MAEKKAGSSEDDEDEKPSATESIRARGHLPQPATLSAKTHSGKMTFASDRLIDGIPDPFTTPILAFHDPDTQRSDAIAAGHELTLAKAGLSEGFTCAIRAEGLPHLVNLVSLDLSSSSSIFEDCWSARVSDNKIFDKIRKSHKPRPLRSSLEHLDVSALRYLEQLSVRGCGNLESLNLPPSLQTLDAGGCSKLERIDFPRGSKGCLTALDIGGCRSLRENKRGMHNRSLPGLLGPSTGAALSNIVNLDMSHVCKGDALDQVFCDALRRTLRLEAFSFRYGATDDVLLALAESESARSGKLRLVDIAFSTSISDKSVETLAKSSPSLERLNLRGCKKVSSSCYNHTPVYLERRRRRVEDGKLLELESFRSCSRKGDNLFYFCQKK